jgi:hypothetical protein
MIEWYTTLNVSNQIAFLGFIVAVIALIVKIYGLFSSKSNKNIQNISGDNSPIVSANKGNVNINYNSNNLEQGQKIPEIYDEEYPIARALLIKAGWIPKRKHWSHGGTVDVKSGNGSYYWNKGYHELVYCSGTGYAMCRFEFKDPKDNLLVIITSGEVSVANDCEAQAKVTGVYLNPKNEKGAYVDIIGAAKIKPE